MTDPRRRPEEALLLRDSGDLTGATACLHQLLAMPRGQFFASVDPELQSVKVRHLLAEVSRTQATPSELGREAFTGVPVDGVTSKSTGCDERIRL